LAGGGVQNNDDIRFPKEDGYMTAGRSCQRPWIDDRNSAVFEATDIAGDDACVIRPGNRGDHQVQRRGSQAGTPPGGKDLGVALQLHSELRRHI